MILALKKTYSVELWMYEKSKVPVFLLEFEKKEFGITCVSLNRTATLICISDVESSKVYKINISESSVSLSKIEGESLSGSIFTKFINEDKILSVSQKGVISWVKVGQEVTVEKKAMLEERDEDMEESDDEDVEYLNKIKRYGYYGVQTNGRYLVF
jgi:hypothetical protein